MSVGRKATFNIVNSCPFHLHHPVWNLNEFELKDYCFSFKYCLLENE